MDPKLPIRSIDYTVIFARQMSKMREFYAKTMGFALHRELSPKWVEYRVGSNVLALAEPGSRFNDSLSPVGNMSLQLAFRVAPQEVDACAKTLEERGVAIVSPPTTNRSAIARCSSATLTATCWKSTQRSFRSLTVHKQTLAEATRSVVALLADPIKINDGMLTARGPGLGLDWNETAVSKYLV